MIEDTPVEELNSVQYVYLRGLSEPKYNSLKLLVEEAMINRAGVAIFHPELEAILKDASPIESVEGCRVFEIYWKHYVAYLVTEELVGLNSVRGYDDESYTGKILRLYSRSHFLDHLARDTGGHVDAVRHYKLVCLNHLIGVAAYAPPEVRVRTCSILTTTPNAVTSAIHDRMPVILDPGSYDLWLDPGITNVQVIAELLKPYDAKAMRSYPVSTRINRVENDDQESSRPVELVQPQDRLF
jgi:hypothetical protein